MDDKKIVKAIASMAETLIDNKAGSAVDSAEYENEAGDRFVVTVKVDCTKAPVKEEAKDGDKPTA